MIDQLRSANGALSFHFSGRAGGALLCLPDGELRIGGFDVLMGDYQGARLYMRTDDAGDWKGRDMVIGLTSGLPRGFTLEAGSGYRFVLHPSPAQGSAGPR